MSVTPPSNAVTYDATSLLIHGQRKFLISGEVHFARSPREQWPELLDQSVKLGINTICTYCFWNVHEPAKDSYCFSGDADLGHFLRLCHERNLSVILRIGPYCCAEWNFGGYPPYLRDEPGIVIRTKNEPYLQRVAKYFRHLIAEILPHLASRRGPVILLQVENEYDIIAERYGSAGREHLTWLANFTVHCGVDVPLMMCEGDAGAIGASTTFAMVEGTLTTVNGFSIPTGRIQGFRRKHPEMPLLWSELWTAWYDTWGYQEHRRDVRNIAYSILEFLGQGGAGFNYYMWHAGTNFGRSSMYLQTTRYGLDAPLDEHGRPTAKALILGRLHAIISRSLDLLFRGKRVHQSLAQGVQETKWTLGDESLRLLTAQKAARLLDGQGRVLFETHPAPPASAVASAPAAWNNLPARLLWHHWPEPLPAKRSGESVSSRDPIEQLSLTRDLTDYCWYSTEFEVTGSDAHTLDLPWGGDFFYVLIDGQVVAQSEGPFRENRGRSTPVTASRPLVITNIHDRQKRGFRHRFTFQAKRGTHRLDLLACALGLIKGDWQIADSMNYERKGIWGSVLLDSHKLRGWTMTPGLSGERLAVSPVTAQLLPWQKPLARPRHFIWHVAPFRLSPALLTANSDFRLDATGLGKGMLYLNGHHLGRYWLIAASGYGPDEGWHGLDENGLSAAPGGAPTQRYYHLPRAWLMAENRLLLFEEQAVTPHQVRIQHRSVQSTRGRKTATSV